MLPRSVVLAFTGGLLLLGAFVSLPVRAGGCHPKSPTPSSARGGHAITVPVKGCEFGPTVVHVPEGAEVTWVNHDPVPHTVTGVHLTWGSLEELSQGERTQFQFDESGTFPYYCYLHPGMAGAVVVGDGESDDIAAAPIAMPPSSGAEPPSTDQAPPKDRTSGLSAASTIGVAVLALAGGVGAGIAVRSRRAGHAKQLPQT
jgi:plastocyanin